MELDVKQSKDRKYVMCRVCDSPIKRGTEFAVLLSWNDGCSIGPFCRQCFINNTKAINEVFNEAYPNE